MDASSSQPFLLFAGGEPLHGDDGRGVVKHFARMRAFAILPPEFNEAPYVDGVRSAPTPWGFPLDVRTCLELVGDLAHRLGRTVSVIDVNRPAAASGLVAQWVRESTLLPLLVAPSGRRLEGLDAFSPRAVRTLLKQG